MNKLLITIIVLSAFSFLISLDDFGFNYKISKNGEDISIYIENKILTFDDIVKVKENKFLKKVFGNTKKKEEIEENDKIVENFVISWNDQIYEIPKKYYEDCINLNLKDLQNENIEISKDNSILINMNGGKGDSTYTVTFLITKNKKCKRFFNMSNNHFIN